MSAKLWTRPDHDVIWLEPRCHCFEDRQWCEDDVWTGEIDRCDEAAIGCPCASSRYLLATPVREAAPDLLAACRAMVACPHIAERDNDPAWTEPETEAAIYVARAAIAKAEGRE